MTEISRDLFWHHNDERMHMLAMGIRRLIYLMPGNDKDLAMSLNSVGAMEIMEIAINRRGPPTPSQLHRVVGTLVDGTRQCLVTADPLRAGFVIAAYRMRVQGWPWLKALSEWMRLSRKRLRPLLWSWHLWRWGRQ